MAEAPEEVALVPAKDEKSAIAEYAGYLDEPDTHDAVPIAPPMLRWQHMGTSSLERTGGKFYNSLEGNDNPYDDIEVVFINGKNSRAYYDSDYDARKVKAEGAQPPDCKSDDAVIGQGMFGPGSDMNPTGRCERCPMSQWEGRGRDSKPPKCSLSYDRLMYDFSTHQVGIMSFARSKISAIREFEKGIKARNGGTVPMWGYKARIYSQPKENYHVPKIEVLGVMPKDEALKFRELKKESDAAFMRASGGLETVANEDEAVLPTAGKAASAKEEAAAY